ncbi:helix-turn-helix transcriptional regulator [Paenibacillus sp. PR3]|uniref:Helix-turn-helix transcriptional regulator n=1 Tax=Paenibacillus terricola TaxID=2763503 RepID=A0ABR8N145_9BACL|nr:helix-turn-helix transcriptional regulator [Paenibacillus terricola]MBD3921911.1 helix-turn-helix transcriptional regulator [Paenibacillus terricola]
MSRFDDIMNRFKTVPGVREYLESFEIQIGKQIFTRRIQLGWSQQQLVERCRQRGYPITQPMLSNIESGKKNIESNTYHIVLEVLGGAESIQIKFGPVPDEKKMTAALTE